MLFNDIPVSALDPTIILHFDPTPSTPLKQPATSATAVHVHQPAAARAVVQQETPPPPPPAVNQLLPHPPTQPPSGRATMATNRPPSAVRSATGMVINTGLATITVDNKPIVIPTGTVLTNEEPPTRQQQPPVASVIRTQPVSSQPVPMATNSKSTNLSVPNSNFPQQASNPPTINSHFQPQQQEFNNRGLPLTFEGRNIPLDRTPTDEEINGLWEDVRGCLTRGLPTPPISGNNNSTVTSTPAQAPQSRFGGYHPDGNNFNGGNSKAPVQMSQKYIDGSQMMPVKASPAPPPPVEPPFARPQFVTSRPVTAKATPTLTESAANTYTKRAALLQQRRLNQNVPPTATAAGTDSNSTTLIHSTIRPIAGATPPTVANGNEERKTLERVRIGYCGNS
jgi:hypothetical protein